LDIALIGASLNQVRRGPPSLSTSDTNKIYLSPYSPI